MFYRTDEPFEKLKSIRPLSPEILARLTEEFMVAYTHDPNVMVCTY